MDEQMQAIEAKVRGTSDYHRAMELIEEEDKLRSRLREVEHQLESLAVAGKLARIDHLRGLITTGIGNAAIYVG